MRLKRLAVAGWPALAACFLLLLGSGCRRPSTSNVPPPPPSRGGSSGSLQSAYSNPIPTSTNNANSTDSANSGPANVQRWNVALKKDTPMLGKRDAVVTIVEFSDFQ